MSVEGPIELDCPKCGRKQTAIVWQSLNAQVSPEARSSLFDGNINVFACKFCGTKGRIPVPLMYHDMERRFVVQYYPSHVIDDDDFISEFDSSGRELELLSMAGDSTASDDDSVPDYMRDPHVVFDMGELVRYVHFRERVFRRR